MPRSRKPSGSSDGGQFARETGGSTNYNREPLRSHYGKSGGVDIGKRTPKEIVDESWTLMSFLDTIYRRHEDKAQASAIVAATRWTA